MSDGMGMIGHDVDISFKTGVMNCRMDVINCCMIYHVMNYKTGAINWAPTPHAMNCTVGMTINIMRYL